jgi:hypothetical protein
MHYHNPTAGIITLAHNCGFVVDSSRGRLVITAGNCLSSLAPCDTPTYADKRTYRAPLGPLGDEPTVTIECLFVNPVADIAVLGPPDDQTWFVEPIAYKEFVTGIGEQDLI